MGLYYQDEHVTLYHGDCLKDHFEWNNADVLVTDPPYGMSYAGFGGRKGEPRRDRDGHRINGDSDTAARDEVLSRWAGQPAIVFGRWSVQRPPLTRQVLIWDKPNIGPGMGALDLPWGPSYEEIYVRGNGFQGRRTGSVLRFPCLMSGDKNRPDHPTPKPIALMEHLIEKCPPGVVADPFAGSGATLIAARNLGRKSIGVESEERYCEIIAKRLDQQVIDFDSLV